MSMMKQTGIACAASLALVAAVSAQTPAGGEFRINTYTTSDQRRANIGMEPDGDFVVVWSSLQQDGSGLGAFGQRFAASGAPRGGELQFNTNTQMAQGDPDVAVGSTGGFVVVWWDSLNPCCPGMGVTIQGHRYDPAGNAVGADFRVNNYTTPTNLQDSQRVVLASDGSFVVSWQGYVDGHGVGIAPRRFDASGNPSGSQFVVNTYTTAGQVRPDLAVSTDGTFVVVWQGGDDLSTSGILGQRFDASGNRLGSEFQVNSYTPLNQVNPSVSASPTGGFVVVWSRQFYVPGSFLEVDARHLDAAGNPAGSDFVVNTFTTGGQYGLFPGQVAHDARGNFVVTWISNLQDGSLRGVFGQRFDSSGSRRGAEFRVNTYTTSVQTRPVVASDAVGNFVVVWDSYLQDGSGYGIIAQRFGGLAPAALVVDSSADRVLEPGETVDVRPTWRNFNGAAQTFSGTLTNVTGPAGAIYTITDAAGDYGTVADGATALCSDCYAVSVSNPTTRPAVHWDASAVESIVPDVQGQQKQWLLHVGESFADVPRSSGFYRFVETLLHRGVTGGCSATEYCPAGSTTREQMAVFVLVAKEGMGYAPPLCTTPVFADVPASSPFCRWIEELARRAVVSGCGGGNYCPSDPVTREQMAVFVLRTLDPILSPPACVPPNLFFDVPETIPFCRWVEELANRGVVTGCGGGNYCPTDAVTREQMGVFITVTFGLTLYGP